MIITQQPTFPNGTQSDMIYVISGSYSGSPQHRYVCRITSNDVILSTIQQVANPYGFGVFEVSRLLDDHMGYEQPWLISGSAPIINSINSNINEFEIAFAEEYGTTPTSPVITTAYISGSTSGSSQVIPAVTEKNSGGFNWDSSSYDALTNAPNIVTTIDSTTAQNALIVSSSDYLTLSTLNGIGPKGELTGVDIKFYDSSFVQQGQGDYLNTYSSTSLNNKLLHVGVGPKNIYSVDALSTFIDDPSSYPYYAVTLEYSGGDSDKHLYLNKPCLAYPGKNFAFINKLGVYDYFRAPLVHTERESFDRKTYKAPYVNYSTTTGTIAYDYATRGETQYLNTFQNNYTAETDWLTTEHATWLFELFESPNVFVQQGSNYVGIIINNASEEYRTNVAGQRMFKFTIEYKLSNPKHSRY